MLEAEAAEEEQEEGGLPMIARFPLPAHGKLQSKDAVGVSGTIIAGELGCIRRNNTRQQCDRWGQMRPTSAPSPASPKALEPPTPTVRDDGAAAMSVADFEREMERWIAQVIPSCPSLLHTTCARKLTCFLAHIRWLY